MEVPPVQGRQLQGAGLPVQGEECARQFQPYAPRQAFCRHHQQIQVAYPFREGAQHQRPVQIHPRQGVPQPLFKDSRDLLALPMDRGRRGIPCMQTVPILHRLSAFITDSTRWSACPGSGGIRSSGPTVPASRGLSGRCSAE